MTYADPAILAARAYLMGRGWPADGLGIVGDRAHAATGGYHCGNDWLAEVGRLTTDYSKRESPRDRPGSNAAMAFDLGGVSGSTLRAISTWIAQQCAAGAPDTADIREVIYSPDGVNVVRWDRLGIRSSGGSDHTWHTHISYHRDSEGRDKLTLFRRYYEGPPLDPTPIPTKRRREENMEYVWYLENPLTYAVERPYHPSPAMRWEEGNVEHAIGWLNGNGINASTKLTATAWNARKARYAEGGVGAF